MEVKTLGIDVGKDMFGVVGLNERAGPSRSSGASPARTVGPDRRERAVRQDTCYSRCYPRWGRRS